MIKSLAALGILTMVLMGCSPATDSNAANSTPAETPAGSAKTEEAASVATIGTDNVVRNAEGKAYCVVMKTPVTMAEADAPKAEHEGVTYYFCCESCPSMFKKDPAKYAVAKN